MNRLNALFARLGLILAFFTFVMVSCQKEVSDDLPGGPTPTPPVLVDDGPRVSASVSGFVVDENNIPVSGATVNAGGTTTTTNRYGAFTIYNVQLSKTNGYVQVTKPGYFTGSRSFLTTAGRNHYVKIKLIPKTNAGSINGASGGSLTLAGGAKITLPAGAVVTAGGAPYNGSVDVAMTWLDPSASDLVQRMPGDLRGITTGGQERGLQTFGMIGVELTGGGQPLKIVSGKKAGLSFPIPASLAAEAPASIALWHFDETAGRWKEEGSATKQGTEYKAEVSHFSFWNCDFPFPAINLCVKVTNTNNEALNRVLVRIKRANSTQAGYGYTDSLGNVCGLVPASEPLVLELLNNCYTVVYTQNIGPFSTNSTVNIAANIPANLSTVITGTVVNCSNANVASGSVQIYYNGGFYQAPVVNGSFTATLYNCTGGNVSYTLLGIDNATVQQSIPVSVISSGGTVNAGTLQACGNSAQEFIEVILDGVTYNFASPPDSMTVSAYTAVAPPPPFTRWTYAGTSRLNAGLVVAQVGLNIHHNTSPGTGSTPGSALSVPGFNAQSITPSPSVVNITAVGPPLTGFIEGNYTTTYVNTGAGPNKNAIVTFRIRRPL